MFLASCQEEKFPEIKETSFSVYAEDGSEPTSASLSYEGGVCFHLIVDAGQDWSVNLAPESDWIMINPSNGRKGLTDVYVSAGENTVKSERNAKVVFTCGDKTQTIDFVQDEFVEQTVQPEVVETVKADLLDVVFKQDGSATDVAPGKKNVEYLERTQRLNVYYDETFGGYVPRFTPDAGLFAGTQWNSGFYRWNYGDDTDFQNALADGHSMETMFRLSQSVADLDKEVKIVSSNGSGGTGLLIHTNASNNQIGFQCYVGGAWRKPLSGVFPEAGEYYHLVGVYDKTNEMAHVYVNGELKGSVPATGDFKHSTYQYFFIGGDPGGATKMENSFAGDIAIARIYDDPLTSEQVEKLFKSVKHNITVAPEVITEKSYLSEAMVYPGCWYYIYGNGFEKGDVLMLESVQDKKMSFICESVHESGCVKLKTQSAMQDGEYDIILSRGGQKTPLGTVALEFVQSPDHISYSSKVVAHRGYHSGAVPENSLASLAQAQKLGVYGSEFDVYITTDDKIVLNHDAVLSGTDMRIDGCTYEQIKDYKLANGESLPTFDACLDLAAEHPDVKLVVEIKSHNTSQNTARCARACYNAVKARNMLDQVIFIAFDYVNACKTIVGLDSDAVVLYLNGDKAPSAVYADGIKGIGYSYSKLTDAWIKEALKLDMIVNVWTVNAKVTMSSFMQKGVTLLSTDYPDIALDILSKPYVSHN